MKLSLHNRNDIIKYYLNTLIKCKETGDVVYFVNAVNKFDIELLDVNDEKVYIDLRDEEYELEYVIPPRCVFQLGDTAHALIRVPAQQYSRGCCSKNTALYKWSASGVWKAEEISIRTLQGYCNKPEYVLPSVPFVQTSRAISKHFSVHKNGTICAYLTTIGKELREGYTIKCNKLFEPELQALYPGWNINAD